MPGIRPPSFTMRSLARCQHCRASSRFLFGPTDPTGRPATFQIAQRHQPGLLTSLSIAQFRKVGRERFKNLKLAAPYFVQVPSSAVQNLRNPALLSLRQVPDQPPAVVSQESSYSLVVDRIPQTVSQLDRHASTAVIRMIHQNVSHLRFHLLFFCASLTVTILPVVPARFGDA